MVKIKNGENNIKPTDGFMGTLSASSHGTLSNCKNTRKLPKEYPRSPLRYPGGKSKAVKDIFSYIPQNTHRLCSPFIGGASLELACASLGIEVYGYDIFPPLVDFWHTILENPLELAESAEKHLPLSKATFYTLQKSYTHIEDKTERAVIFYVLNRSSFSGTTLSGGMSPGHKRFNAAAIKRVKNFKASNIRIETKDFRESIALHKNDFLYLDPPYANGQALYGARGDTHKDFDHEALFEILTHRENWILSYNDCAFVRKLYTDFQCIPLTWNYGMNNSKKSNEILIVSKDLSA